jgi:hypothetical protein
MVKEQMISIPKTTDTNTAPAKEDSITEKDRAIVKAPAPMLNALAQTGLSLSSREWLIPAIFFTSYIEGLVLYSSRK